MEGKGNADSLFARFYETYPRKAERDKARKAWDRAIRRADPEHIIAGAASYRADPNREREFTKYPASWLTAGCWEDDPLPARKPRGSDTSANPRMVASVFDRLQGLPSLESGAR